MALTTDQSCRICGNMQHNRVHEAREMMFGTHDIFHYLECGACKCLQLLDVPADLGRYYPPGYYSFEEPAVSDSSLKRWLKRYRARYALTRSPRNVVGWAATLVWGTPQWHAWLGGRKVDFDSKILDVGSGNGAHLRALAKDGFRHLLGIDPFVAHDSNEDGVVIKKQELADTAGEFDFIMMHHSFEHMYDSRAVLRELYRLLRPGHFALVRMPVVAEAWERYGVDWVSLDPPRHLIVHSEASMKLIAQEAGFSLDGIVYDSGAFQFWASEQYKKDIPLMDPRSYRTDREHSIFSQKELAHFAAEAKMLNAAYRGDQAGFFLYKPE
jgi:SAM-dependent methyltransferase